MADINIQRKQTPVWPWIVGGLVLVLLVLLFAGVFEGDDMEYDDTLGVDTTTEETTPAYNERDTMTPTSGDARARVESYVTFVSEGNIEEQMGRDHDYTSTALKNLAMALDAVAAQSAGDTDVERLRSELMQKADRIQQDPTATNHADMVRDAAVTAADLMERLQQQRYPNLGGEVTDVREAATAIDPGMQLLNQKDRISTFFQEAGQALEAMAQV